jgi:RNA polymerase sigma-70 factor (ECF subfamily)
VSTSELLELAKAGDAQAVNVLFARYTQSLRPWARGRLPGFARDMLDTDDVVQETVFQTLKRLQSFEPQHEGALQAYLQQAVINRIRDEVRRAGRHPADAFIDEAASPLDEAIGRDAADRYEGALQRLKPEERQALILRNELQLPYAQVAQEMKMPSADAARTAVARALVRLAEEMGYEEAAPEPARDAPPRPSPRPRRIRRKDLDLQALSDAESLPAMTTLGGALGEDLFLAGPICRATVKVRSVSALLDLEAISARLPYASLASDVARVVLVAVHASGAIRGVSGHVKRRGAYLIVHLEPTGVIDPQGDEPPSLDGNLTWSFNLAVVDRATHARHA